MEITLTDERVVELAGKWGLSTDKPLSNLRPLVNAMLAAKIQEFADTYNFEAETGPESKETIICETCPACEERFVVKPDQSPKMCGLTFCSDVCLNAYTRDSAPLVRPQPRRVRIEGWDI
jgi:hypothetical protein